MDLIDMLCLLIVLVMFQAYQIWSMQRNHEEMLDLIIGLHLGDINIEEVDEDDD